jgi:hypothetical protein
MDAVASGACTGRERCGVRRSRVVLAPRPWRYAGGSDPAGNGGKKGRFPGESTYKPSNHCAGKAGMSRLYLSNPCAFFLCFSTRRCGRSRRPAFPAPSSRRGTKKVQDPGENLPRERARMLVYSTVSAPGLTGRPSIPETAVIDPKGPGVRDHPHTRVMTSAAFAGTTAVGRYRSSQ